MFAVSNVLVFSLLNHLFFFLIILCIKGFNFSIVGHLRQLFHLVVLFQSFFFFFQSDIKQIVKSFIVSKLKMIMDITKP